MNMNKQKVSVRKNSIDSFDSRYRSEEEKLKESIALLESRIARLKELPQKDVLRARLLQLKLQMESYIQTRKPKSFENFQYFLNAYLVILYKKKTDFANDLGTTPVMLSHLLSGRREPSKEFLYKLMTHSRKVAKGIPAFKDEIWLAVFHKDLMNSFMNDRSNWKTKAEKEVSWQGVND